MSDWLYNAGIVGLVNALKFNKDKVAIYNQYIEIDSSVLDNFEDKYFNYLIDKYLVFTSWYRITDFQKQIEFMKEQDEYSKENIDVINNQIEFLKKKLTSNSYISAYGVIADKSLNLVNEAKALKKITKRKNQEIKDITPDIEYQLSLIENIIEFTNRSEVKKHLLAKDLTYTVISTFWSDRSFLHRSKSTADIYEEYQDYFISGINSYLEEDKSKANYSCFNCDNKINKLNKSHNLTWLQNIGVDGTKKASHFWDLNRDDVICPICNLVYSCIPLGFTYLKGNGLFINNNTDIESLLKSNTYALKAQDKIEELEYQSYSKIADSFSQYEINQIESEISNIQIIKLDANKQFNPYTFNILSKDMVRFLAKNSKVLSCLINKKILWYTDASSVKHYVYLYKEVIDRMHKNENLFSLIDFALNKAARGEHHSLVEIDMLLSLNNNFIRGGDNMNKHIDSKKIYKIKCLGNTLKSSYDNRKASNKLNGISYRLLNAVKVKDANKFLDTIINAYAYIGMEIPTVFINCLDDTETFQTVGYAFILGLMGEISDNTKNANKGDVGTNE